MQRYAVIWRRAATLSLRFLVGRVTGVLSPVVPQAGRGRRGVCYLTQPFGPAAPAACSCAAADIIVRTAQGHRGEQGLCT